MQLTPPTLAATAAGSALLASEESTKEEAGQLAAAAEAMEAESDKRPVALAAGTAGLWIAFLFRCPCMHAEASTSAYL